jgi:hypothetical protein
VEILVFALFAVVAVVVGVLGHKAEKKRMSEMQAFASHMGLRLSTARTSEMERRFPLFSALREGSNRYAYNVMEGRHQDRPCCLFDYHYETYSTDSKGRRTTHHHHFSAVVVECGLPLKYILMLTYCLFYSM